MREKRKTHEMLVKHKTVNVEPEEEQEDEPTKKKLESASESDLKVHHILSLFSVYYYIGSSFLLPVSLTCFLSQNLIIISF